MDELKDGIKFIASLFIILAVVLGYSYIFYRAGYEQAKKEVQPVIIHAVDNAGGVMAGQITDKEIVEGRYTVTAGAYGKFLVTKEQYESLKVGDDIPDYLKKRGTASNDKP